MKLEEIQRGIVLSGIVSGKLVTVVAAERVGRDALELTYRVDGSLGQRMLSRSDEDGVLSVLDHQKPPLQTQRRPPSRKVFVLTVALLIALGLGGYLVWFRAKPNIEGPASNDMPVVIRTNGGMLEVATVKHQRTFNLTNMHVVLGYPVPFCKERASYTVDTYITYRVRLAKHWIAIHEKPRLLVIAPRLEPALPVAFDTSRLQSALQKCSVMPSLDTQNDLLRRISAMLEADARSPRYIEFARQNGARDTVREFVQTWLISQKRYDIPTDAPIDVEFDDE